jgi:hypothetical protein
VSFTEHEDRREDKNEKNYVDHRDHSTEVSDRNYIEGRGKSENEDKGVRKRARVRVSIRSYIRGCN